MTTLAVSAALNDPLYASIEAAGLRLPERVGDPFGPRTFSWTPDLSAADLQAINDLVRLTNSAKPMSLTAYQAVRPQMQTLRDLRQLGRNAFLNLTAAERDRQLYDAMTAVTTVLLAILRDDPQFSVTGVDDGDHPALLLRDEDSDLVE